MTVIPAICCIIRAPITTHCSPHSVDADLHSSNTLNWSINQTNCSISAMLGSYREKLLHNGKQYVFMLCFFCGTPLIKPFKPDSTLLITSYCTLGRKDSLRALARRFCASRNGVTGGGGSGGSGWIHPQGAVHMAAARLGCKRIMVGTGWANSHPGCMSRFSKRYPHFHFWQGRLLGL